MLKGKIIQDGPHFHVKVGSVEIDVTDAVTAIVEQRLAARVDAHAKEHAKIADVRQRYEQIQQIVLAGGVGMPTGGGPTS
jgi:hypothetical protein